jgi:hypothetical protein
MVEVVVVVAIVVTGVGSGALLYLLPTTTTCAATNNNQVHGMGMMLYNISPPCHVYECTISCEAAEML